MSGVRFVDELGFAYGWIAPEPRFMQRTSHAVALHGRVWMIDPVADETALGRARELGVRPALCSCSTGTAVTAAPSPNSLASHTTNFPSSPRQGRRSRS